MKIIDIFEDNKPALLVADRDFALVQNSEYKGYVLGADNDSDSEVKKVTWAVYKPSGSEEFTHVGKIFQNNLYQRITTVIDPKTGKQLSPYVRSTHDAIPAFRSTVNGIISGKILPEKVGVSPAATWEDKTISSTPAYGDIQTPVLKEKEFGQRSTFTTNTNVEFKPMSDRVTSLENWIIRLINFYAKSDDPAKLFSPVTKDYIPYKLKVNNAYDTDGKQAFENIKRKYPDLVRKATLYTNKGSQDDDLNESRKVKKKIAKPQYLPESSNKITAIKWMRSLVEWHKQNKKDPSTLFESTSRNYIPYRLHAYGDWNITTRAAFNLVKTENTKI